MYPNECVKDLLPLVMAHLERIGICEEKGETEKSSNQNTQFIWGLFTIIGRGNKTNVA